MKKVFRIMLTTVMMVAFSVVVIAQEKNVQTPTKRQRVSREQMAEMQAKHISRQLALDDATSQKFIETYCAYQKEVWALRPHKKEMRQNRSEMKTPMQKRPSRSSLTTVKRYYPFVRSITKNTTLSYRPNKFSVSMIWRNRP